MIILERSLRNVVQAQLGGPAAGKSCRGSSRGRRQHGPQVGRGGGRRPFGRNGSRRTRSCLGPQDSAPRGHIGAGTDLRHTRVVAGGSRRTRWLFKVWLGSTAAWPLISGPRIRRLRRSCRRVLRPPLASVCGCTVLASRSKRALCAVASCARLPAQRCIRGRCVRFRSRKRESPRAPAPSQGPCAARGRVAGVYAAPAGGRSIEFRASRLQRLLPTPTTRLKAHSHRNLYRSRGPGAKLTTSHLPCLGWPCALVSQFCEADPRPRLQSVAAPKSSGSRAGACRFEAPRAPWTTEARGPRATVGAHFSRGRRQSRARWHVLRADTSTAPPPIAPGLSPFDPGPSLTRATTGPMHRDAIALAGD